MWIKMCFDRMYNVPENKLKILSTLMLGGEVFDQDTCLDGTSLD